ncbi:iron-containing alcohol dehydrogenase [bacterium]|jgi:4-hydroxybutyrate dehydrogenase|nr:iron-containing alcohol dehydrogenase [bacterium]MDB4796608.1 iron-containing alcohol dehydrogenase [bacterium]
MSSVTGSFSFPTQIEFGPAKIEVLPSVLSEKGVSKPLVVTDAGFAGTESFDKIRKSLDSAEVSWTLFSEVHSNPLEADVHGALACYRENQCDGVVGIGGGSPLDVAKAVRLLIKVPTLNLSTFNYEDDWSGLVPFIAIPTTAGTGSEVGRSAVITPQSTKRKAVLFHPELLAVVAILDPELTVSLPAHLTAATGVDALTHCIESYTSPVFQPLCDGIALEGIRMIRESLPLLKDDPSNVAARGQMLVSAAMGGIAFQKDLGATHSMAHPLSTLHGMHHGLANALCLPVVMEFNAAAQPGVYRQIALAMGEDVVKADDPTADQAAIGAVRGLLETLEIPMGLSRHGINETDVAALTDEAILDPCHQTNPVPVSRENFVALYTAAL